MKVLLVIPASGGPRGGNRVTAERWSRLLGELGHETRIDDGYRGQGCDVLIALHACRSAPSILCFHEARPAAALVVALTGTDLYGDLQAREDALRSLELASRIVVLQPLAGEQLPQELWSKVRSILQSSEVVPQAAGAAEDRFEVCVMGHLRPVKDPFRAAEAARLLPPESKIHILHVGAALAPEMAERARAEQELSSRYHWLGELPRQDALRVLARSRLLVLSSLMEGGANVVSEAIVQGVPVLSSRINGSIGMLGSDYPAYFPVGDTAALAALLARAESDADFYETLRRRVREQAQLFRPEREREAWRALLAELG